MAVFPKIVGQEIERKFLVLGEPWRGIRGTEIEQFYVASGDGATVRVRIAEDAAYLTIKGPNIGCVRAEFEYAIPVGDARAMRDVFPDAPGLAKIRYRVPHAGWIWEIDVFHGTHAGLVLAEIELPAADTVFSVPDWVGEEVTSDSRFFNSNLARQRSNNTEGDHP